MPDRHVNENVKIVVLPSAKVASYAATASNRIQQAVRDNVLLTASEPYHKVQVEVEHREDGSPKAMVAYALRSYTYTADVFQLGVDASYAVKSVKALSPEDAIAAAITPRPEPTPPRPIRRPPDMVFGTPVPEIETAKAAVEYAYTLATSLGYKAVKLLGPAANLANYQKYLLAHVKVFGSVGHGYTGGIVLADGNLTSGWFASQARKALCPAAVYFNSCQVFNPPLQPAIMAAGARTFVGGKVNLLIGPSEKVFMCFWTKALLLLSKMGAALTDCEKINYPVAGAHGISGDTGLFLPIPAC